MPRSVSVDGVLVYIGNEKASISSMRIMVDVKKTGFRVCRKF